jgi:ABC-type multidrug transport system permease subunit
MGSAVDYLSSPAFILARMTFIREASSKMYSPIVFALTQLAAETPYSILCAVGYFVLFYVSSACGLFTAFGASTHIQTQVPRRI